MLYVDLDLNVNKRTNQFICRDTRTLWNLRNILLSDSAALQWSAINICIFVLCAFCCSRRTNTGLYEYTMKIDVAHCELVSQLLKPFDDILWLPQVSV